MQIHDKKIIRGSKNYMISEEFKRVLIQGYGFVIIVAFLSLQMLFMISREEVLYSKRENEIKECITEWKGSFDEKNITDLWQRFAS